METKIPGPAPDAETLKCLEEFDANLVELVNLCSASPKMFMGTFELQKYNKVLVYVRFSSAERACYGAKRLVKSAKTNVCLEKRHWLRFIEDKKDDKHKTHDWVRGTKAIRKILKTTTPSLVQGISEWLASEGSSVAFLFGIRYEIGSSTFYRQFSIHPVGIACEKKSENLSEAVKHEYANDPRFAAGHDKIREMLGIKSKPGEDTKEICQAMAFYAADTTCSACGKPNAPKKCGGCKVSRYCNKECQLLYTKAGKHTKRMCVVLREITIMCKEELLTMA